MIDLKTTDEIDRIRTASTVVAEALDMIAEMMIPGVTTAEIDTKIERFIRDAGGVPAFLGYQGYPASSCISLNDEVVHGIPNSDRELHEGDIVGVDIGVKLDGFYGDSARTFAVGRVEPRVERLLEVTRDALHQGIQEARVGNRVGHISAAIQRHAEGAGFSVVRTLVGHGVGRRLHEEPAVPNFGKPGDGPPLEPGMVLAIEPMVNLGARDVRTLADGWTIVTADGSLSAHFEHSVAILAGGPEILSVPSQEPGRAAEGRG
jgi:methionyl aminopeptidase